MSRTRDLNPARLTRANADDAASARFQRTFQPTAESMFLGSNASLSPLLGSDSSGARFSKPDLTMAFPADGVGDRLNQLPLQSAADVLAAAAVADDIPNDETTTRTVVVGGPHLVSTINTPGDQDWFAVTLQAGVTYEIGEYGTRFGASHVPLRDPLVELYDSDGNLVISDDSGGPDNNVSDDALIVFTPTETGTYYINARAWDTSDPVGLGVDLNPATTTGDYIGDYEVFARISTLPPDYYRIRYETEDNPATARDEIGLPTLDSSPLHAIDWQTQFDGTSRNPDGAEGPRVTGNPVESKIGGKNVIYYYFAREGEVFVDNSANPLNLTTTIVAQGMQPWEKNAVNLALDRYEQVADIVYVETEDRYAADIVVVTYPGTPGPGLSLLGRMSPPDTPSEGQTEYNAADERWSMEGLAPGGFYFATLIHELGHGHGLAHPHDDGGRSSILRGVEEVSTATYTLGDFELNQGVFTMMSYQDGWQTSPYGQPDSTDGYGFIGSLMAMDIAAIQDKYGVNEEWATGNDTYVLEDENHTASFDANGNLTREATSYKSIWDAGGIDSIVYNGTRNANIDLRPATLRYEFGGGGWVSYAFGVHGGFTIANSVTIELAFSGAGNDVIIGNQSNNYIDGGWGVDRLEGGGGDDTIIVNAGDIVYEGIGFGLDNVASRDSYILNPEPEIEVLSTTDHGGLANIYLVGNGFGQTIIGNAGNNYLDGAGGIDRLQGLGGNDALIVDADDIVIEAVGGGLDNVAARTSFTLNAGAEVEVLSTTDHGGLAAINLTGNEFGQTVIGNAGANVLNGGLGADRLQGLGGNDTFAFTTALGSSNIDSIFDFQQGSDKIGLGQSVFTGLALGALGAGAFRTGTSAQDGDDRIIYDPTSGALLFDADGAGGAAAVQFASVTPGLNLGASDFIVI